ncbi:HYC_CC_PP family protein [Crocinitomix algicola]|uniref:HYC_CC_PP family protein n=1 Tax=Crocinitomix algicola TaxID=1740263 RepID=UPI00082FD22A|nr:hypothetical protein [Crocinitomix algicola]
MKILRSIAPFLLIPLLLVSTIGFSLEVHFCGDEIKSIGLFEAEKCDMEKDVLSAEEFEKLPPCHQKKYLAEQESKEGNGFCQNNCCHDEQLNFDSEDATKQATVNYTDLNEIQAILIYAAIDFQLFNPTKFVSNYRAYKPPLLRQDITVLQQVFRI